MAAVGVVVAVKLTGELEQVGDEVVALVRPEVGGVGAASYRPREKRLDVVDVAELKTPAQERHSGFERYLRFWSTRSCPRRSRRTREMADTRETPATC